MKNLPFWFPKKNNIIWYIIFTTIFLLSMDYWGWYNSKPLILGLPLWIIYFIILTLSTSVIFYLFSETHWEHDK
jgi:hypothetical protein